MALQSQRRSLTTRPVRPSSSRSTSFNHGGRGEHSYRVALFLTIVLIEHEEERSCTHLLLSRECFLGPSQSSSAQYPRTLLRPRPGPDLTLVVPRGGNVLQTALMMSPDFQHILRVLNTNIDGRRKVMYALTKIQGIGARFSNLICKKAEVDPTKR